MHQYQKLCFDQNWIHWYWRNTGFRSTKCLLRLSPFPNSIRNSIRKHFQPVLTFQWICLPVVLHCVWRGKAVWEKLWWKHGAAALSSPKAPCQDQEGDSASRKQVLLPVKCGCSVDVAIVRVWSKPDHILATKGEQGTTLDAFFFFLLASGSTSSDWSVWSPWLWQKEVFLGEKKQTNSMRFILQSPWINAK